jgi:hypothetical protein
MSRTPSNRQTPTRIMPIYLPRDHRRADIPVSQKLLNRPDVVAVFEEMGGKGVPEHRMRTIRPRVRATLSGVGLAAAGGGR